MWGQASGGGDVSKASHMLWWIALAAAVPAAGFALRWASEKNKYALHEYNYRPGTISGYIANILALHAKRRRQRAPVRVYMDGCFDMMHYGHANALRQARALGDELVVGLIPDSEILRCKGPPVMSEVERKVLVESVKWVDEVITGVPYDLTPQFLDELLNKHAIDYVIHGDDPCILPDGTDAYEHAKKLGRFRLIKRTEGVSSTDIVGRMLMCTRDNARFRNKGDLAEKFSKGRLEQSPERGSSSSGKESRELGPSVSFSSRTVVSRFLPTSRRIVQFSDGNVAPPNARIVYVDGAFDLFHVGHVEILKKAKRQGDFLLVGLHTDEDVGERRGPHLPIMDLHERSLSVLSCRYVDEVIIGAPLYVTEDLLTTFNISLVCRGTISETSEPGQPDAAGPRYAVPARRNMLSILESPNDMTTASIIRRIVQNRESYEIRNAKKGKSESDYYATKKTYIAEV